MPHRQLLVDMCLELIDKLIFTGDAQKLLVGCFVSFIVITSAYLAMLKIVAAKA